MQPTLLQFDWSQEPCCFISLHACEANNPVEEIGCRHLHYLHMRLVFHMPMLVYLQQPGHFCYLELFKLL